MWTGCCLDFGGEMFPTTSDSPNTLCSADLETVKQAVI